MLQDRYSRSRLSRRVFVCATALAIGLTAPSAWAQRVSDSQGQPTGSVKIQKTNRAQPAAPARQTMAPAPAPVVNAIQVEGVQRLEAETVMSYLALRKGEAAGSTQLNDSVKALFATGLFADVNLRMEGNTLHVRVEENPVVNQVLFEGNSEVKTEDLTKEVQIKPRLVYTLPRVQRDVQRLLDVYRRSGRFAATVEPKLVRQPQNRVDVVFEINEGARTGIQSINFVGNEHYSVSTLRGVINTRESAWWRFFSSADFYDPARINYDRDLLRKFYLNEGYVDFRVLSANAELTPDKEDFFITFNVDEGVRYKYGTVKIVSEIKGLDGALYAEHLVTKSGEWYNASEVERSIDKLTTAIDRLRFTFAEATPDIDRQKDGAVVNITYRIHEGPHIFVSRIDVEGNTRTMDKVVRREMALAEGDAFNKAKLERSERQRDPLCLDTADHLSRDPPRSRAFSGYPERCEIPLRWAEARKIHTLPVEAGTYLD